MSKWRGSGFGRLTRTAAVAIALALPAGAGAQHVELVPGADVVLRGSTNVGEWRCAVRAVDVRAGDGLERAVVRLPVVDVDCGSDRMEADLRNALRADRHPAIVLRDVRIVQSVDDVATVTATLEVAGVARGVSARVRWRSSGERLELSGALPLRMTDFGVTPPRALLGMVRARDEVVVEYDVALLIDPALRAAAQRIVRLGS